MPRYPIDRATNFIVEDESWTVVEYDHTSVPGVIYLSLTEGKVNFIYDDLVDNIADTDKLAEYKISAPAEQQKFKVGDVINPIFTLMKNGKPYDAEIDLIPESTNTVKSIQGTLTAVEEGEANIKIRLKDFPQIETTVTIQITNESSDLSAYIDGVEKIRLDRKAEYTLISNVPLDEPVIFSLDTNLASIVSNENNHCVLHANDKNLLGEFVLSAHYKNIDYTKSIKIIPLW